MSLLPFVLNLSNIEPLFNDYGFVLNPEELIRQNPSHLVVRPSCSYKQPSPHSGGKSINKSLISKDGGFQVSVDVTDFTPDELSVKTVDKTIVVEGKHEEKEDQHGRIYRHFIRKYELPEQMDVKEVVSTLSSEGVLTIKAIPEQKTADEKKERVIQIQRTGPAKAAVANETASDGEKMTE